MNALVIEKRDNVAVVLSDVAPGDRVEASGLVLTARDVIPTGHKIALRDIEAGAPVIKYGESIGRATAAIGAGQHVHSHNLESMRGRGDLI